MVGLCHYSWLLTWRSTVLMNNGCLLKQPISYSFFRGCYTQGVVCDHHVSPSIYFHCAFNMSSNMMRLEGTGVTPIKYNRLIQNKGSFLFDRCVKCRATILTHPTVSTLFSFIYLFPFNISIPEACSN